MTQRYRETGFRWGQIGSASLVSLAHGTNDAQKTMGIIAGALVAGGYLDLIDGKLPIPFWVIMAAHAAIALGTLSGGWRIIHTMGSRITKLQPVGGFAGDGRSPERRICSRESSTSGSGTGTADMRARV